MMSRFLPLMLAAVAGMGLGLFYFGGLWLTVQRLPACRRPGSLVLASFLARTAVILVGFYLVMDGRWEPVLACLLGFIMVRLFLVSRLQPEHESRIAREKEVV